MVVDRKENLDEDTAEGGGATRAFIRLTVQLIATILMNGIADNARNSRRTDQNLLVSRTQPDGYGPLFLFVASASHGKPQGPSTYPASRACLRMTNIENTILRHLLPLPPGWSLLLALHFVQRPDGRSS